MRIWLWLLVTMAVACAHRVQPGPLLPLDTEHQQEGVLTADDNSVTHVRQRLEVSLRPLTDAELNRQFGAPATPGGHPANPFTYGAWVPAGETQTPQRFTVFLLTVDNYEYPKVLVDPLAAILRSENGRTYESLSFEVLREYFYPYNVAYAGNHAQRFRHRTDLLKRTLYARDDYVFAGQSREGYLLFPVLHDDVEQVVVEIPGVGVRFDYRDEPTERLDLVFRFVREVTRRALGTAPGAS